MKIPIKLLLKIYDTMVVPILIYGAEVWAASCKFNPDIWDKTETGKQHTSLLKLILGPLPILQSMLNLDDYLFY